MVRKAIESLNTLSQFGINIDFTDPVVQRKIKALRENLRAKTKSKDPCPYFQRGECKLGNICKLSHNILIAHFIPPNYNQTINKPKRYVKSRSTSTCPLFLKGDCRLGSHCPNAHPLVIPDFNTSYIDSC